VIEAARLGISASDLGHIEALARAALPYEACGLLVGLPARPEDPTARVTQVIESANLAAPAARDRFEIDPKLQFATLRELRGKSEAIIGVYHSHPNGRSEPSSRDLADANDPGLIWLVTGMPEVGPPTTRAFVLTAATDRFHEIPIETA
jgi:proteasome lid subunit RPN8/RPN11